MKLDFLKGAKTVIGILGLVAIALLRQFDLLPIEALDSLQTVFQGLVGFGLVMKAERFLAKKK